MWRPAFWLYAAGARRRRRRWKGRGRRLPHPVLSIGNLTFGGTGKTPCVEFCCRALKERGLRPGVLSRGYKAAGPDGNDEARVLRRRLPDVIQAFGPDRYAVGLAVQDEVDVYVLDDGFQHLPLHRDVDLVLVDATDPFGGGYCPPVGRLREAAESLAEADAVILTRADLVEREALGEVMRQVRARTAAPVATAVLEPSGPDGLSGTEVLMACGIGNPYSFRRGLEALGAVVVGERVFRDHHAYTEADARALSTVGLPVAVTEKDAVKLEPLWSPEGPPLLVVGVDFRLQDGDDAILALLDGLGKG